MDERAGSRLMPAPIILKANAPGRAMDEGALDLLTRTTDFDHGYIRFDRALIKLFV